MLSVSGLPSPTKSLIITFPFFFLGWGQCLVSTSITDNNMRNIQSSLQMFLKEMQYLVELKLKCKSLRLCVKYYPNFILPQPFEQLRALFGNQAYFLNVGVLS